MVAPESVIVYSCVTGGRDKIKRLGFRDDFRYVMFTDQEVGDCDWEVKRISAPDPLRAARYHKHHPHELFPEASVTIWIDGTHWPYTSLAPLLELLGDNHIAASRHYCRANSFDEASVCMESGMGDVDRIRSQTAAYRAEGFRDDLGLYETSYLVRRNGKPLVELQELWWSQMVKYCMRDQISLTYCLWRLNIGISVIPGVCRCGRNDFFKMRPHRKNPDLILI